MFLGATQPFIKEPFDKDEIHSAIDARSRLVLSVGIGIVLSTLSFLLLNPFLAIFILSIYSLYADSYVKHAKLTVFIFAISLAVFYANRDIMPLAGDDVAVYELLYLRDQEISLASIFSRYFMFPPNNEILYFSSVWIIGKILNPGMQTLMFIVYFGQLTLLSVIAYLVSKRYSVVFLFIFFFGISDPGPHIIHIWRASLGSFVFMIGMLLYFNRDPKVGRILIFASLGFHLSLMLFILVFEFYVFMRKRSGLFVTFMLGALVFYISVDLFQTVLGIIFPTKAALFFDFEAREKNFTELFVLITLLAGNYYSTLSPAARFATFTFLVFFILGFGLDSVSSFMPRLGQIAFPIAAIPIFEIVMKCHKLFILSISGLLLIRAIYRPVTVFYSYLLPHYKEPFSGIFNLFL